MSDEILLNDLSRGEESSKGNEPSKGKIIYQHDAGSAEKQPEFNPGNTPHTQYGDEILNANVPWQAVVEEIQAHYTQERLVDEAGVTPANLRKIAGGNYNGLDFRTGARILGVHSRLFPEQY